jgi:hypothetical protein
MSRETRTGTRWHDRHRPVAESAVQAVPLSVVGTEALSVRLSGPPAMGVPARGGAGCDMAAVSSFNALEARRGGKRSLASKDEDFNKRTYQGRLKDRTLNRVCCHRGHRR